MDPLTGALTSLKTASDLARGLIAAETSVGKADLKLKIAELAEALVAARLAVVDAQDTIREQRDEIARLKNVDGIRQRMVKRRDTYFLSEVEGESGPYCPRCWEVDGRLVTLARTPSHSPAVRLGGAYRCPQCNKYFS